MSVIKGIARANLKLVELVQTGYIIHGKSVEERMMNFDRIISEHNRKHDKQWLFYDTRLYEIPRPSRYKDLYARELKRRNDRRTIAFLCKHVMAEKNVKIPMK
ncbi:unnamed protein product (macronuclear) [Paramecium tetraurelia]|uniref:Uncharacterized protein n=1 Tax=Paramecium tetraurelia TaxID=5888 RepID=A0BEA4_PARTE|nr:uncharacterized protein GSPATT00027904001 [Paramecium tetraurelia]CAK56871.1 unnamed protein product [Paramecium tetraurelia]|eukprot:XP_001424269.1 hypothetical protein (macronuclear) [Paramecium tetraurelia strain d4-2]